MLKLKQMCIFDSDSHRRPPSGESGSWVLVPNLAPISSVIWSEYFVGP